jgi:nucleotide-binding universal stress UspA family protein
MLKRIIVPLDGSHLAERALPYAVRLAQFFEAKLLLLHVAPLHTIHLLVQEGPMSEETLPVTATQAYQTRVDEILERAVVPGLRLRDRPDLPGISLDTLIPDETSRDYLQQVRKTLTRPGQLYHLPFERIETKVVYGQTVPELSVITELEKPDLIVMATHARSGLTRLVFSNVGAELLQRPGVEVILIRPTLINSGQSLTEILSEPVALCPSANQHILLTLSGNKGDEAVIAPAIEMAQKMNACVHLLSIVAELDPLINPNHAAAGLDGLQSTRKSHQLSAASYIDKVERWFKATGVPVKKAIRIGNTVDQILDYVRTTNPCMLAMATHGRNRMGDFFLGSVAEEVIRRSHLPVLTVHTGIQTL